MAAVVWLCTACSNNKKNPAFPEKADIYKPAYSNLFEIAFYENDTFLKLKNPADSTALLGAFYWGMGKNKINGFTRITHRKKIVALSAVFVGMMEALHREDLIVAVDNGNYITSRRTLAGIENGKIISVAPGGSVNKEQVARLKPDIVFGYFIDQKGKEALEQLTLEGIQVIYLQNFLESHPLGRAEWVLVLGALTGNWDIAKAQFAEIEEHYLSTEIRAKASKFRPTVICNAPFSGIWDVPSGDSYMARLIDDAGGNYVYADHRGAGRIPLDIEKVFTKARNADYWLNPGACRDTACMILIDKRLSGFKAYSQGNLFNSTRLQKANGANAWWEYGVLRADLALLDIFSILHPEAAREHELVFFEKLH